MFSSYLTVYDYHDAALFINNIRLVRNRCLTCKYLGAKIYFLTGVGFILVKIFIIHKHYLTIALRFCFFYFYFYYVLQEKTAIIACIYSVQKLCVLLYIFIILIFLYSGVGSLLVWL